MTNPIDPVTRALHSHSKCSDAFPSVTPLFQSSAFESGSEYFYTRKNNPNIEEFEQVVSGMENAASGIAVSTGMAAIRLCLDLLRPGDSMVLNTLVYGCAFKLIQRFCDRFNVQLHLMDLTSQDEIKRIPAQTRMIMFETPTNPFLQTVSIGEVSKFARENCASALVVVDNTWATPLFQHPLEHGADISLHSATKYMSGHSDVMGGIVLTNDEDLATEIRSERFYSGAVLDPYAAWLLRRSMQTFGVRLDRQSATTKEMRDFLSGLPQIEKVYYPKIDGEQLREYGGILFVALRTDLADKYQELVKSLSHFGSGTGMACVTSMIAQPYTGSHASMTDSEKEAIGLSKSLVRLCFGLESPSDLREDLTRAFQSIDNG